MSGRKAYALSYLDLLISTLEEHEKALSGLVDRLERMLNGAQRDSLILRYYESL
ncbi:MAG: hypothetical protein OEZ48_03730 [Candidatus Bathyarchaeota archaeon]|nr:hypothetical protein [Candidatus Bathyarchaeota archaeon]